MTVGITPGVICLITGGTNRGRICVALCDRGDGEWLCEALQTVDLVRRRSAGGWGRRSFPAGMTFACLAQQLLPLHDGDGRDETLAWADVPSEPSEAVAFWERS